MTPALRISALGALLGSFGALHCGASHGEPASTPEVQNPDAGCDASAGETEAGVTLAVDGGTLYGTSVVPVACRAVADALIIAGSGPTDRDGNDLPSLDTNAYAQLAVQLAQQATASIRYDKRGVAASAAAGPSESALTFDTYVDDARAWVRSMRQRGAGRVVVVGHSEGSLIGILASQTEAVDALVSLEGSGRPAGELLRSQLAAQLSGDTLTQASSIIDQLEAGRTVASVPSSLATLFRPSVQPYLISWFRYDPAAEIAKLSIPVLIVQGTADVQTTAQDADLLAGAALHATEVLVSGMTHTLKLSSPTDPRQMLAYTDPSLPLAPGLVTALDAFLAKGF